MPFDRFRRKLRNPPNPLFPKKRLDAQPKISNRPLPRPSNPFNRIQKLITKRLDQPILRHRAPLYEKPDSLHQRSPLRKLPDRRLRIPQLRLRERRRPNLPLRLQIDRGQLDFIYKRPCSSLRRKPPPDFIRRQTEPRPKLPQMDPTDNLPFFLPLPNHKPDRLHAPGRCPKLVQTQALKLPLTHLN